MVAGDGGAVLLLFPLLLIGLIGWGSSVGLALALSRRLRSRGMGVGACAVWHRQSASKVTLVDFYALLTGRSVPDTDRSVSVNGTAGTSEPTHVPTTRC